jgi:hypothetical protein
MALHALEVGGDSNLAALDTLAAACAESGRFTEAATNAQRALERTEAARQEQPAAKLRQRSQIYQAHRPLRTE